MLHGVRLVTLANEDAARARFDRLFAEADVQPHLAGETQYSLTVCNLVRHRVGVGLVNPFSLDGLDLGGLVTRPFLPAIHFRGLIVRPPEAPTSRIVEAYVTFARQARENFAAASVLGTSDD